MKKVIVVGATGSLAEYVITTLIELPDVELTLFVRNKRRLMRGIPDSCSVIEGDALKYTDLKNAISGQDIVYVNLAGSLEAMAKNIVGAMKNTGVNRVIAISSIGIYDLPLKPVLIPYRQLSDVIESSGLAYTILRPDWFTNVDEVDYVLTKKGQPEIGTAISRESIAAFVATLVKNPDLYVNQNLGISKPN